MDWGEVNPTHAYNNGSCTSKDTEDPSWSTSFKTRRTEKTSLALEDFICVVFVPDRNIISNSREMEGKGLGGSKQTSTKNLDAPAEEARKAAEEVEKKKKENEDAERRRKAMEDKRVVEEQENKRKAKQDRKNAEDVERRRNEEAER
ncbi:hypothetical protein Tco_0260946 [Tanacetum coccineum]